MAEHIRLLGAPQLVVTRGWAYQFWRRMGTLGRGITDSDRAPLQRMTNHPNRSKRAPHSARNPAPDQIRRAREAAGLTQTQAAALIYCTLSAWQRWEAGERSMHPAFWELFLSRETTPGLRPFKP